MYPNLVRRTTTLIYISPQNTPDQHLRKLMSLGISAIFCKLPYNLSILLVKRFYLHRTRIEYYAWTAYHNIFYSKWFTKFVTHNVLSNNRQAVLKYSWQKVGLQVGGRWCRGIFPLCPSLLWPLKISEVSLILKTLYT